MRTTAAYSDLLGASGPSVNRVVAQMLLRSQTKNRAELVARAYVEGVLDVEVWPPRLTGRNLVRLARDRRQAEVAVIAEGARASGTTLGRHPQESCR